MISVTRRSSLSKDGYPTPIAQPTARSQEVNMEFVAESHSRGSEGMADRRGCAFPFHLDFSRWLNFRLVFCLAYS